MLSVDDICFKKPVKGIAAGDYEKIIGARALKNLFRGAALDWADIEVKGE